jgi:hypothetical protein
MAAISEATPTPQLPQRAPLGLATILHAGAHERVTTIQQSCWRRMRNAPLWRARAIGTVLEPDALRRRSGLH